MKNVVEKFSKGSLVIFISLLISSALGFFFVLFLSRELPISEFGLFYSVMAFVAIFNIFRDFGLSASLIKHIAEFNAKKDYKKIKSATITVFLVHLILALVIFIPLMIFADDIEKLFFGISPAALVLQIILFENIINLGVTAYVFQGMQKFKIFAMFEVVRISILFGITYFLIDMGVVGVAYANLATTFIMGVVFLFIMLKEYPYIFFKEKFELDWNLSKKIIKFGAFIWIGSVLTSIITRSDIILLTYFRNLAEVGLYNAALITAAILLIFARPIRETLYPIISDLWARQQKNKVTKGVAIITKMILVAILPLSIIFIVFPEIVIGNTFGSEFIKASTTLVILSLSTMLIAISTIFIITIMAINKPKETAKIALIGATLNIIFNLLLIPSYGIEGAAISTLVSSIAVLIMSVRFLKNKIKLQFQTKEIATAIFGGVLMILITSLAKGVIILNNVILETFIVLSIAFIFYAIYIVYFRVIKKEDFDLFLMSNIPIPESIKKKIYQILRE